MNVLEKIKDFKISRNAIIGLAALGFVFVAGIAYYTMSSPSGEKGAKEDLVKALFGKTEKRFPVEVQEVQIDKISKLLTSVGTLVAYQAVVLKTDTPGRVKQILFTEGLPTVKDAILIEFEDDMNKADVKAAEAKHEMAKAEFDRSQELHDKKYLSSKEREKVVATLKQSEAELDIARIKLEKTKIKAPFDGVVGIMKDVSIGAYIQPQVDLVTIVNLNPMKVDFKIPGTYLKSVQMGQKVKVTVDGFEDKEIEGEIDAIDSKVDSIGHQLTVRAKIPNQEGQLKPGLFARVAIVVGENDKAIVIPEKAVERNGNLEFVYTVVKGDTAAMVPVITGVKEAGRVEILKGLKPKDVVIVAGTVRDGYPIKISKTPEAKIKDINPLGMKK